MAIVDSILKISSTIMCHYHIKVDESASVKNCLDYYLDVKIFVTKTAFFGQ